jgi:3-phenylpropionate/cinnamic acid dioxygenase small subunit
MISDADRAVATDFLYREARLADEARYAEWLALWTDDGVYWVPATTDPAASPDTHISHVYDNRARIDTRVKLLQTGQRYSQEPASLMRRLISNVEVTAAGGGELAVESNFILGELAIQSKHEMHWWDHASPAPGGRRAAHGRQEGRAGERAEPLPNLSFLI